MELNVEEREESCSIVSKIVKLKIYRRVIEGTVLQEGKSWVTIAAHQVQIVRQDVIIGS
ncbi:MAG: hypothetical protein NHB14_11905 [Desulfosporosinus sp.]|nr:hypothetical protein [Desulfosporosinus sp.]